MARELYEQTYTDKRHFSFGKNWLAFHAHLTPERITEAERSLTALLGPLKGKTFIDVGCGSGLFSLAAHNLGARVTSIDADKYSIEATTVLRDTLHAKQWTIKQGSVLNERFVRSLGTYDVVYSWGVLHHTGHMYKAFTTVEKLVKPRGLLCIAIYNDNKRVLEGTSPFWLRVKRRYNKASTITKRLMEWLYSAYLFVGLTASGKNPVRYIRNYRTQRGMSFSTDIKDWLGGYPYEYASTEEITTYFEQRGYKRKKVKTVRSIGCNEFVFQRAR
jgi:2-polyprenyl-3-methyl-5-hydroxy-6-metoxy-1,4-benzoquinol methylase